MRPLEPACGRRRDRLRRASHRDRPAEPVSVVERPGDVQLAQQLSSPLQRKPPSAPKVHQAPHPLHGEGRRGPCRRRACGRGRQREHRDAAEADLRERGRVVRTQCQQQGHCHLLRLNKRTHYHRICQGGAGRNCREEGLSRLTRTRRQGIRPRIQRVLPRPRQELGRFDSHGEHDSRKYHTRDLFQRRAARRRLQDGADPLVRQGQVDIAGPFAFGEGRLPALT